MIPEPEPEPEPLELRLNKEVEERRVEGLLKRAIREGVGLPESSSYLLRRGRGRWGQHWMLTKITFRIGVNKTNDE